MRQLRAPNLAELVVMIPDLPDGPERTFLERCYWGKAATRHGVGPSGTSRGHAYQCEYEWLRARARRLEAVRARPALGAYLNRQRAS